MNSHEAAIISTFLEGYQRWPQIHTLQPLTGRRKNDGNNKTFAWVSTEVEYSVASTVDIQTVIKQCKDARCFDIDSPEA